jgi:hypothetical protein
VSGCETAEGEPIDSRQPKGRDRSVSISGRVRIIVRAYDRADGIAAYRKLGPYRLGYQVMKANGEAAPGFETADATLNFDRLPTDPPVGAECLCIWQRVRVMKARRYLTTSSRIRFGDGRASEGYWDNVAIAVRSLYIYASSLRLRPQQNDS